MHVFLSPHPDDAALSCGGQIADLTRNGTPVLIVTLMAGRPAPDFAPTPFTQELEARWAFDGDAVSRRREEDAASAAILGASIVFGDIPDAPYRTDGRGTALYPDVRSIFGGLHSADLEHLPDLARSLPVLHTGDVLHAPLAAGHHVDHQLVRDAALWVAHQRSDLTLFFYEDYPYTAQDSEAVHAAVQAMSLPLDWMTHPISDAALDAKIAAIACHASQISTFWSDTEAMARAVRDYTAAGESEWRWERMITRD